MIVDTLANNLVEAKRLQSQIERKAAKSTKRKSPKKPTGKRSARGRRARAGNLDSSDLSTSDSEAPLCSTSQGQGRTRPAYDPNTIVLDCDDEFFGGPAVNFTRNVAAATAVSVEESMDLKVNVRIKGEIEQFVMNSVSFISNIHDNFDYI